MTGPRQRNGDTTGREAARSSCYGDGMSAPTPPDHSPRTLERWVSGPRFAALPAREADHPPPLLSFEFMPPKTEAMEQQLWTCIRRLEPLRPRFVSVTYGAGGSTQTRTHATVARIVRETTLVPAAHLTCVGARREEQQKAADGAAKKDSN